MIKAAFSISIFSIFFWTTFASGTAQAQTGSGGDVGLGVILGSPTGVSGKLYLSKRNAVDAALGFGYGPGLHVHVDYLFEGGDLLASEPEFRLGWFAGAGGRFESHSRRRRNRDPEDPDDDYIEFGPRFPIGLEFRAASVPQLEFFAEIALAVVLIEDSYPRLDGGIGGRFYF